jgi:hypothetical protein
MPIQHAIWKVGEAPVALSTCQLASEQQLEDMIVRDPRILSGEWLLIGLETVPESKAINEVGLFGNQNTVCQPTTPKWRHTVDRLKTYFTKWNETA